MNPPRHLSESLLLALRAGDTPAVVKGVQHLIGLPLLNALHVAIEHKDQVTLAAILPGALRRGAPASDIFEALLESDKQPLFFELLPFVPQTADLLSVFKAATREGHTDCAVALVPRVGREEVRLGLGLALKGDHRATFKALAPHLPGASANLVLRELAGQSNAIDLALPLVLALPARDRARLVREVNEVPTVSTFKGHVRLLNSLVPTMDQETCQKWAKDQRLANQLPLLVERLQVLEAEKPLIAEASNKRRLRR